MSIAPGTKLVPPQKRTALIDRPSLHARFSRIRDNRLLLVCAPAGYGKTTVLIQAHEHLRAQGRHVAWISLDEDDKDLTRFASYLLEAAGGNGVARQVPTATRVGTEVTLAPDTLRTSVLNELAMLRDEVYVILDDYHLITDPGIRNLVNTIVLSPVQQLRFLIASRTHNELPLSRLRALGQIQEVEVSDLTFSESEVSEFVARLRGRPISPAQVSRLRNVTESWAASLQMASIALRDVQDVDRFLDRFTGEHRSVGDFLGDEVLQRQPAELEEFLTLISILKRFNWSLCNAVTGASDSRARLEELERRNLFLFSLDPERKWFRLHHLFSGFLRRRFADRYPERLAESHLRASHWLAEHGYMTDAIEHAFDAGEVERAGELLDRASADLFAAGQTSTLMDLSSRLPKTLLEGLPRLQLERAWYSELSWKFADARIALERVQVVLDAGNSRFCQGEDERKALESKLAHRRLMLMVLADDMPGTIRLAREWAAQDTTRDAFMNASSGTALIAAKRVMFQCEGVQTSARMLQAGYMEGGALYGVVFHQCVTGNALFERGDLDFAHDAYEKALQVAVELQGEHSALYNMPALLLSELHYERNQLSSAEEMLAQREISSELGFVDNLMAGFVTRSRLHDLRGRAMEAEGLLREGAWLAAWYGFARMQATLLEERTRILLKHGHATEVQALHREFTRVHDLAAPEAPGEASTLRDLAIAMAFSRVWIQEGNARAAVLLLRKWSAFTRARHCHRSAIRSGVLLARAQLAAGDRRGALRTLGETLVLGEHGRFIRSFIDEGRDIEELILETEGASGHQADSRLRDYVGMLRRVRENPDELDLLSAARLCPEAGDREVLSSREIQIIELGSRGLQNADIAKTLFLAQSTVKWYWQRIYEKLDVRRRPDAIRVARENHWVR